MNPWGLRLNQSTRLTVIFKVSPINQEALFNLLEREPEAQEGIKLCLTLLVCCVADPGSLCVRLSTRGPLLVSHFGVCALLRHCFSSLPSEPPVFWREILCTQPRGCTRQNTLALRHDLPYVSRHTQPKIEPPGSESFHCLEEMGKPIGETNRGSVASVYYRKSLKSLSWGWKQTHLVRL